MHIDNDREEDKTQSQTKIIMPLAPMLSSIVHIISCPKCNAFMSFPYNSHVKYKLSQESTVTIMEKSHCLPKHEMQIIVYYYTNLGSKTL